MTNDRLYDAALASFLVFAGCSGSSPAPQECPDSHQTSTPTVPDPEPTTPDPATADVDRDGVTVAAGDCDDFNNTIHPAAPETGWDGVDSDCDDQDGPTILTEYAGPRTFEEFVRLCDQSAMLDGSARPGVVEMHASCSGVNACRGMSYGDWGEDAILTDHGCRAMNWCVGWSCVETGPGLNTPVEEMYATNCAYCHNWVEGDENPAPAFKVMVPPGQDPAAVLAAFPTLPDERLRSAIAFGKAGITSSGHAYANMPTFVKRMSRAEIDTMVAYVRSLPATTTEGFGYPDGSTIP
ncbi:MAG: c-type cytochrome [Myxococcota bacterium]